MCKLQNGKNDNAWDTIFSRQKQLHSTERIKKMGWFHLTPTGWKGLCYNFTDLIAQTVKRNLGCSLLWVILICSKVFGNLCISVNFKIRYFMIISLDLHTRDFRNAIL